MSEEKVKFLEELDRQWSVHNVAPDLSTLMASWSNVDEETLQGLVTMDAGRRWDLGQPAKLEDYARADPEILERTEIRQQLLILEVTRRMKEDPEALARDLQERFPELSSELTLVLDLCELLNESRMTTTKLVAGDRIAHYELTREIGHGSFARVWMAWDENLHRHVALKILESLDSRNREAQDLVLDEARRSAVIDHPNVIRIHAAGRDPVTDLCYIDSQLGGETSNLEGRANEPILGTNLEEFVEQNPDRTWRQCGGLIRDVARGVAAAHARGVVHRDLKPANVVLAPSGVPLVTDFGLASSLPLWWRPETPGISSSQILLVDQHRIVGTPAFMAPEVAAGEEASPSSDIYGLGAILYFVLAGRPPRLPCGKYDARPVQDVLEQIRRDPSTPELDSEVPASIRDICRKALARNPSDRYLSAERMSRDLESWLDHRPTSIGPRGWPARSLLWLRRYPILTLASLVLVIGNAAWITSLLSSLEQDERRKDATAQDQGRPSLRGPRSRSRRSSR